MAKQLAIQVDRVRKKFGNNLIFDDLTFAVHNGEFVSIVGPSGCGKTTLLKIIANLLELTRGEVSVGKKEEVSFAFQEPSLLPWRTAIENIMLPLELQKKQNIGEVKRLLSLMGLKDSGSKFPHELSRGMQQRVSLARALVTEPSVLIMDEPSASLDEKTRMKINIDLLNLKSRGGFDLKTILYVTHSIAEAVFLSDKIIVLSDKPSRILKIVNINLPKKRTALVKKSAQYRRYVQWIHNLLGQ